MASPLNLNPYFAPKRVEVHPGAQHPTPATPPSTTYADPNMLAQLAQMLIRTQKQRAQENAGPPPDVTTPPFTVPPQPANYGTLAGPQAQGAAMPPTLPPYVQPGSTMPPFTNTPNQPPAQTAQAPPILPPQAPVIAPGEQPTPASPSTFPSTSALDMPAKSPSVWETMKRMFAQGKFPEGYRGAMGEMIKND